jgi:hypothetical protein
MSQPPVPKTIDVEPGALAQWVPQEISAGFLVDTTLPQSTDVERARVLDIVEGDEIKGREAVGSVIFLSDYVMHPVKVVNKQTGELSDGIRTLLLQPDSPPVSFVSAGILKSIGRIAWRYGKLPPYNPPIRVKLKQKSLGGGRVTYKLEPVE